MKKILFLLFMMLPFGGFVTSAMTLASDGGPSSRNIVLKKDGAHKDSEVPRSPAKPVFTCYYEDGNVCLKAAFELGIADVSIQNLSTGETWTYSWDSATAWVSFPTSDMEGEYVIEIETESHGSYTGYYEL